jgi:hypothetical protein
MNEVMDEISTRVKSIHDKKTKKKLIKQNSDITILSCCGWSAF